MFLLLGVNNVQIINLNASTKTNVANLNASIIYASLITNVLSINSCLNQSLDIMANPLNLSLNTNVCFLLNPTGIYNFLSVII